MAKMVAGVVKEELSVMESNDRRSAAGAEAGFALILALLALLLLTFLGLTLAVTTSTELQIATNYRWSEQARYVAEAGVEAGKLILRDAPTWQNILPPPRDAAWSGTATPTIFDTPEAGVRDYENWDCDMKGAGMGFGRVLRSGGTVWQNQTTYRERSVNGAFTLWVRRPLWIGPEGTFTDWGRPIDLPPAPLVPQTDDNLILVVEGVAPFTGAAMAATTGATADLVGRSKAVYLIEVALSRTPPTPNNCQTSRTGQAGHGSGNTGFAGCEPLAADALSGALQDSTATGSGAALPGGSSGPIR
ncbi:MAG: PilX N-terminal domain-containing pilus assembly protein [Vicinamibacteria bacterium]